MGAKVKNCMAQGLKVRSFRVRAEECLLDGGLLWSGMTDGSVLGALVFPLYVNEIVGGLENPCLIFAKNIKLSGTANGEANQRDMGIAHQWSMGWDLSLNLGKFQRLLDL